MSCIISKKAIKIGNLEKENNSLKRVVQQIDSEEICEIGANDLNELDNMPPEEFGDMTFVRTALLKMYKADINQLKTKALKGVKPRPYKRKDGTIVQKTKKFPLTPEKVEQIRKLYGKRVGFTGNRFKSFNRHVCNSLSKIQNRLCNPARKLTIL